MAIGDGCGETKHVCLENENGLSGIEEGKYDETGEQKIIAAEDSAWKSVGYLFLFWVVAAE